MTEPNQVCPSVVQMATNYGSILVRLSLARKAVSVVLHVPQLQGSYGQSPPVHGACIKNILWPSSTQVIVQPWKVQLDLFGIMQERIPVSKPRLKLVFICTVSTTPYNLVQCCGS